MMSDTILVEKISASYLSEENLMQIEYEKCLKEFKNKIESVVDAIQQISKKKLAKS